MANSNLKTLHPWLQENSTQTSSGSTIHSFSHDNGDDDIFCIVHGYPQSSYMWRHVLPAWKPHFSLFIPELPGYGISTPLPTTSNKRATGLAILSALSQTFHLPTTTSAPSPRKIHWIAHDRGARIGHRLLTSPSSDPVSPPLTSAVLIDIVPTLAQWASFSSPASSTAYFHWPFLASSSAPHLIETLGGDVFCRALLARGRGSNEAGMARLDQHDAYEHYASLFSRRETIEGSCADYAEGSVAESEAQAREQAEGRKVKVPLLVVYSEGSLGRMHDVEGVWRDWVEDQGRVRFFGVGEGHGHYLPESADGLVAEEVGRFVKGL